MKTVFFLIALIAFGNAYSQDKDTMEKRAKALVEALNSGDKAKYKKFIEENYTVELINRKMHQKIEGGAAPAQTQTADADALTSKVNMFERFHQDLGTGKITSIKQDGDKIKMDVAGGMQLSFTLGYAKESPHLINSLGVTAEAGN